MANQPRRSGGDQGNIARSAVELHAEQTVLALCDALIGEAVDEMEVGAARKAVAREVGAGLGRAALTILVSMIVAGVHEESDVIATLHAEVSSVGALAGTNCAEMRH